MGFRIRKSIKIAPGLRINLSKSGISTSVGKPGATVNVGKNGVKSTVGIPGTGISYSQNHSRKKKYDKNQEQQQPTSKTTPWWVAVGIILFLMWLIFKIS